MGRGKRRRHSALTVWMAVLAVVCVGWSAQEAAAAKRVALVIGNGAYEKGPLRNPANDAQDMAESLRQLGFEVLKRENADQRTMEEAIRDFGKKLTPGSVGLFYYSGHGIQVDGRNYLMPVGARIETASDVKYEAVDAGRVLGKMEDAGNDLNIVILDACRDNPFAKSFRSESRGLARMDAPSGSLIAYATAPGEVAADGSGRNGTYTKHLLRHMQTPGLPIEHLLKKVRVDVTRETFEQQVPWESSSLRGDFYFKPKAQEAAAAVPAPEKASEEHPPRSDREALFWESIKDSDDPDFFRAYLEEYPEGAFAAIARLKLEKVQESTPDKAAAEERTPQTASIPSEPTPPLETAAGGSDIVAQDDRYIAYANGVVRDTSTDLEWIAGPERVDFLKAKRWVLKLNKDGGGWRLPSMNELKSLYIKGMGTRNMTPLLNEKVWRFWSGEEGNYPFNAWTLNFYARGEMEANTFSGVLAVRAPNRK